MNDESKNIDNLFSEGLGNLNPTPPPELWEKIGAGIPTQAPVVPVLGTGRIVAIGISAAVIFGLAILWVLTGNNSPEPKQTESVQQQEMPSATKSPEIKDKETTVEKSETTESKPAVKHENTTPVKAPEAKTATNLSEKSTIALSTSVKVEKTVPVSEPILKSQPEDQASVAKSDPANTTLADLRRDFTSWLSAQPAGFNIVSATSVFNNQYKNSQKLALPKRIHIPLIGGIYAGLDMIDYGTGNRKQSNSVGLSLSTFKGPLSLETGVALNLSEDNGRYLINYNSLDSIGYYNKVVSFSPDPQNPGTIHFNTEVQDVFDSIDHSLESKTTNRYTYLQIPLIAGYQIYSNRLLTISLKAGPVFSLMLNSTEPGITFNQDGTNLQSIDNLSPARVSTNWQIAAGLGVGLHLLSRFTLMVEPTYKTYLRPVYRNYRSNPYSIGLKAGLLYRF